MPETSSKKVRINWKTLSKRFVIWVIGLHVFVLFTAVGRDVVGRPFPVAKIYLDTAVLVDSFYLNPLSHLAGIQSPITQPFYWLRDFLYDRGMAALPKDEIAEREMWWFKIKYNEFFALYFHEMQKFLNDQGEGSIDPHVYLDWTNLPYSHLLNLMSHHKLTDDKLKSQILVLVTYEVLHYIHNRANMYYAMNQPPHMPDPATYNNVFINSDKEMFKLKSLLDNFIKTLDYIKKYDASNFEEFRKSKDYLDGILFLYESSETWLSYAQYHHSLTCDNDMFKTFTGSKEIILSELKTNTFISEENRRYYAGQVHNVQEDLLLDFLKKQCQAY